MTAADIAAILDAVADRAERLRQGGVREVAIDGIVVKLDANPTTVVIGNESADKGAPRVDPMNDPATYGLPRGSKVPGLNWGEFNEASERRDRELGNSPRRR